MNSESLLSGANLAFLEELYAEYRADPARVDPSWLPLFEELAPSRDGTRQAFSKSNGGAHHAILARKANGHGAHAEAEAPALAQGRLDDLIQAYRLHGHLRADLDPLGMMSHVETPQLEASYYGFSAPDLARAFDANGLPLKSPAPLRDILSTLEETYCRHVGVEYMHLVDERERQWLQQRMEAVRNTPAFDEQVQHRILTKLSYAENFESFLHKKYVGAKRFSLSGAESLIPMLDALVERAATRGVKEIVLGMAHRGRLNVLTNIFGKTPAMMFSEFETSHDPWATLGSGDVKYHLGFSTDHTTDAGGAIHLTMAFNPSHLEFIDPVVEGRVRAKQDRRQDRARETIMPVLIHGDAAFMGQGVVMETLNLGGLEGYRTGGTVHIVINNQVGFTTEPEDTRSAPYCTEIAKFTLAPIFHVNADDPEACVYVTELAMDFRQQFHRDVVVDLVCYRRHGHNEGDEPAFTQPVMYRKIRQQQPVRARYAESLVQRRRLSAAKADAIAQTCTIEYTNALEQARARPPGERISSLAGVWRPFKSGADKSVPEVPTNVSEKKLRALGEHLAQAPSEFELHPKVKKLLEQRLQMAQGESPIDWGMGELLALASLVEQGTRVRLTGQDVRRGTFSSRHAVVTSQTTGKRYCALQALGKTQGPFEIFDSPLSEIGVLGFEFGYSLDSPDALVVWEAQFGDFCNAAQVIVDQFISSSADKWKRLSGLVLMLPHGYEGQGPEHSSARLERFLQLSATENLQVCNLTTPAQHFHALRRQVLRPSRKPLVMMTPKSLLRHPLAVSALEELTEGAFHRVIGDAAAKPKKTTRVILCSGKIYYDLLEERQNRRATHVAIVRVEQLYPFPEDQLRAELSRYRAMEHLVWVQEEPENMGAAFFMAPRLTALFGAKAKPTIVARQKSASPATGSKESHELEQGLVLAQAFGADA